ncbi:hypothetical protein KSS87_015127 [Heliosperma pusillum]|nr:hypothetical protein KSS87_015127 [Heliosperma pusillum]
MEVLSSSFFSSTPSLNTLSKKTRLKLHKTHLKCFPTTNFSLLNPKKSHITARFGGPTKRRNSLRKKLTGGNNDTQVIPKDPNFIDPVHHFVDNQVNHVPEVDLGGVSLEIDSGKVENFENDCKMSGDSALLDKLEGWVELYKKDIEFWGIGSNPIFVVLQDSSSGKVDKVLVDQDEILRRNGVDPLYFRKVGDLEEFNEVKGKISHARLLAREVESGKDVISRNSSVARFVVSGGGGGEGLGLVSRIRSMSVPKNVVIKVSRIGIGVVCGVLFVWMVKKVLGLGGKGGEASRREEEMLRRKMKARAEKEKMVKGSVEIVEEVSGLPDVVAKRPQFDKEVVLDGIRKAKGLSSDLTLVNDGGASTEKDFRVKEIQMMARRAREIESGERSVTEGNDSDVENLIKLKDMTPDTMDSDKLDDLESQSSIALPAMEKSSSEEIVEGLRENVTEARAVNGISETKLSESQESTSGDCKSPCEVDSEVVENVELFKDSSERTTIDKKSQTGDIRFHDSSIVSEQPKSDMSDVSSSRVIPPIKTPVRRMPKIIRSVEEAREYLSLKSENGGVGDVSTYVNQRLGKEEKAVKSSDVDRILDSDPTVNVCEYEEDKEMENDAIRSHEEPRVVSTPLKSLESGEISTVDIDLSLERVRDVDELLKPSNSCEIPEALSDGNVSLDGNPDVNGDLSSSAWLDKVDDRTPRPTDSSEISNFVPDQISSYDVRNSGVSSADGESAPHYSNLHEREHLLNERGLTDLNGLNGTPNLDSSSMKPEETELISTEINDQGNFSNNHVESKLPSPDTYLDSESSKEDRVGSFSPGKESWLEKNFHEMDPIANKIRAGFRDSYMVARDKVKEDVGPTLDFMDLSSLNDNTELEWMKDEKLREIVFKVRDNELAGRDPFHLMDLDDKAAFFEGLESKVEKENQKLATLHQWLHSNIENIDYGADGISIYDSPEKVIPKWKGPPIDDIPEFLNSEDRQQETSSLQKGTQSTEHNYTGTSQEVSITKPRPEKKVVKSPKTVIEASDGSIKPGKKHGKEYWQHTKKWSRGFVESYNAESDPDVKSTIKDIGKDLDRWITEKEVQEAADLMDKLPQRGKDFIEKKMNKLKREMELFGPQAVVSKYHEYADDKEEDYLWWLDLPHVLCIEMYTYEGEDQEVGFYTLEMAEDLELEPKPQHVIAFQDPSDCKNFCYIIQAHLEMLGKGNAFIVPQHPKDVFREAKANGFGVTVIRKGEVQLNVDQPLEEVEELISEIGSKIYHDKIMKDRSVDISSLMKGVFGFNKPIKRVEAAAQMSPERLACRFLSCVVSEKSPTFLGSNGDLPVHIFKLIT